jgi:hypothetical protein
MCYLLTRIVKQRWIFLSINTSRRKLSSDRRDANDEKMDRRNDGKPCTRPPSGYRNSKKRPVAGITHNHCLHFLHRSLNYLKSLSMGLYQKHRWLSDSGLNLISFSLIALSVDDIHSLLVFAAGGGFLSLECNFAYPSWCRPPQEWH